MKRIYTIVIGIYACLGISAQTANDVIQRMQEIRQESGDSIARDYLANNQSVFINEDANPTYFVLWGVLTSNMWNSNPSETLRVEYKKYLDSAIDDEIKSEKFMPDQESLPTIWQLTYDYYNMLYREGDKETTLLLLSNIHRWFEPYAEAKNSWGYARSLLDLCILLIRDMHKYKDGEPFCREYVDVAKNVYGANSAEYAVALYNISVLPQTQSEERIKLLKDAIAIYKGAGTPDSAMLKQMEKGLNMQIATTTGVTSTIDIKDEKGLSMEDCSTLVMAGKGDMAINSLKHYKDVLWNEEYVDTLKYTSVITLLINAYMQLGELASAQNEIDSFNNTIGISVDKLPSEYVQIFFSSAGLVAYRLKNYPLALRYSHAACSMFERIGGYGIEYSKVLANIAMIYAEAGQNVGSQFYLDAKWYIDEAVSIFEERVGSLTESGSLGITLLSNKALVYASIGDTEDAIATFENIVNSFSNNAEVRSAWVLAANNLATMYMKTGKNERAIELLESLSTDNRVEGELFKANLALAYYVSGDNKMKTTLSDYNNICYNNSLDVFNFFTVAEREDYWTRIARELLVINNLIADKYPNVTDVAFDNLLFVKNLKLMSSNILKGIVENSSNMELKRKYNRISSLRDAISYRSNEKDSIRIWNQQLQEEERSILSMIPDYKERLLKAFHSWKEIKEALKDDEIAVDFTYVPKMKGWDDAEGFYGAFVITRDSSNPQLVSLCEVDSINQYFSGAISDAVQISKLYQESLPIYQSLWGKLEKYFKGKKKIYFSPTGQLNLLNHNALLMPTGDCFGDHYNLVRLSSTDKILTQDFETKQYQSAIVYGGILYDLSVAEMKEAAQKYGLHNEDQFFLAMRSEDERGRWNYLPGTRIESLNIDSLLSSNNIMTTLLQERNANEESFKALSGHSPQIIHLSTHGFFLDTVEKEKKNPFMSTIGSYSDKEDKLIRTGILMAGANNVWCGMDQVSGIEDGILTADEISRLDLSGTKLVVLSACETAKGQIDEIDGVLGLQRGLKKAGVESILMSLWKVNDTATQMLMTEFYKNLCLGKNKRESLILAQKKVREYKSPDGIYIFQAPYYWAGFVMLD